MSELPRLVRALRRGASGITDWVAIERVARVAWTGDGAVGERMTHGLRAVVHRDVPAGRGSATLEVGPGVAMNAVVDDAASRALAAVGPAWRSPPPAASARVALEDPAANDAALGGLPRQIADELDAAIAGRDVGQFDRIDVAVERAEVTLATQRGLEARWVETRYTIDAVLVGTSTRTRVARRARRREDLAIRAAVDAAVASQHRRAVAPPLSPGRYPIAMTASAFLHGGRGLLEAIVGQADPALERQGLVRYRPGQIVAAGAAATADPLTVSSDGTVPFGLRSAPLDDDGIAIRRFELIDRGAARGLSLDAREAALRGQQPNGGARGLVVPAGDANDVTADVIIEELAWLELAPVTGRFRAGIALARQGGADLAGGIVRGDAIAALALGRRSKETVATPEYRGPAVWDLGELVID